MSENVPEELRQPNRHICYHGVAVLGVETIDDQELMAVRLYGHEWPSGELEDPEDHPQVADVTDYLLDISEALLLVHAIMTGYQQMTDDQKARLAAVTGEINPGGRYN